MQGTAECVIYQVSWLLFKQSVVRSLVDLFGQCAQFKQDSEAFLRICGGYWMQCQCAWHLLLALFFSAQIY